MSILIKQGRVIDPANKRDGVFDILVENGKIAKVSKSITAKADITINAKGKIVTPGLVDMHAHLREPGREDEETIASGTRAAARGGFTSVFCMPNTDPVLDNAKIIEELKRTIAKDAITNVFIIGAITVGQSQAALVDFVSLKEAGTRWFSDDGSSVESPEFLLKALKASVKQNFLLIEHCEDKKISKTGVMNKGLVATKTGLRGIPKESEFIRVRRDIELAEKADARLHIAHVSCLESAELIKKAKKSGIKITAETAPHYFSLTDEACQCYDANTKVNPPLKSKEDVEAIKKALEDNTIDIIATDHAPHTDAEKGVEFDFAPFGMTGFESALSVCIEELIDKKVLNWPKLIEKLSVSPSRISGIQKGTLTEGRDADITIIDPEKKWVYKKEERASRSSNSPFIGKQLKGMATDVIVGGRVVMNDRQLCL